MKICDWCSSEFQPNVNYQIYCSSECRDSATKQKVRDRYKKKKHQKLVNKERRCSGGCGTLLSAYNESQFCNLCIINYKQVNKALRELKGLIEYEGLEE